MKIEKALERIELQVKVNWWDNLMYISWFGSLLLALIGLWLGFIFLIVVTISIQIAEHYQKKIIRRLYENGDNETFCS